ncbi:hypothetical protein J8273_6192 [Carpediemonas membranifera]|uniref:Uncharacterized protein n=1 Tax=Carpediemonas membranifera TaxID=201153 RepID=A0A8J6E245_9EUKA|nr:hypothetical protein J8273_6192 [Carpediemonas membranifera]|eukprot:KAG9391432.1 hypothetical protein J8273_6192 [Carpediemonas membranifera]
MDADGRPLAVEERLYALHDLAQKKLAKARNEFDADLRDEADELVTFTPKISERTRKLAEKRAKRDDTASPIAQRRREAIKAHMLAEMPFSPTISEKAKRIVREKDAAESLYELSLKRQAERAMQQVERHVVPTPSPSRPHTADVYNRMRELPIEDDLLLREEQRRRQRVRQLWRMAKEERGRHKPTINPRSAEIVRNMGQSTIDRLTKPKTVPRKEIFEDPEATFTPQINETSKQLDRVRVSGFKRMEAYQGQKPRPVMMTPKDLDESENLTFKPKLMTTLGERDDNIIDRLNSWKTERQQTMDTLKQEQEAREAQECTFIPNVRSPSLASSRLAPPKKVGGIPEFLARQQKARQEKLEKERRLCPADSWRPRVTKTEEFHFGHRPKEIKSLKRPNERKAGSLQSSQTIRPLVDLEAEEEAKALMAMPAAGTPWPHGDTEDETEEEGFDDEFVEQEEVEADAGPQDDPVLSRDELTDYSHALFNASQGQKVPLEYAKLQDEKKGVMSSMALSRARGWKTKL